MQVPMRADMRDIDARVESGLQDGLAFGDPDEQTVDCDVTAFYRMTPISCRASLVRSFITLSRTNQTMPIDTL